MSRFTSSRLVPLAIVAAMLVAAALRLSGVRLLGGPADPRSREFLAEVAAAVNRDAPIRVDSDTEMIGAEGLEGVLVYRLRLVQYSARQLEAAQIREAMRPQLVEGACGASASSRELLDQGVTLRYSYADKEGRPVTSIDVTAADCRR